MAKITTRVERYSVKKVPGSRGEFGRSDQWAVVQWMKTVRDGVDGVFPATPCIKSRHNSKEAAERALLRCPT